MIIFCTFAIARGDSSVLLHSVDQAQIVGAADDTC
jgi:hypothetical protein